jgi:hypothetical protein
VGLLYGIFICSNMDVPTRMTPFDITDIASYSLNDLQDYLRNTDADYRRSSASVRREQYGRWQRHASVIEKEMTERTTDQDFLREYGI